MCSAATAGFTKYMQLRPNLKEEQQFQHSPKSSALSNIILNNLVIKISKMKKNFHYKVLDIVKLNYNFGVGHVFIRGCSEISKF